MTTQDPRMMALAQRALSHFRDGSTDQADAILPMPVDAYINPERYAAERSRIFKTLPLALALSLEVPEVGDFVTLNVIDTPVLIVRGIDGEVRAFLNACRHRGALVCSEDRGNKRVFSCPYHAWVYDQQGALTGRYGGDTFGEVDSDALGLTALPCEEVSGLVWVCLTPGNDLDIQAWLGGFADELNSLQLHNWHLYEQRDIVGPGWKVTMDGYLEAYHHNLVHQKTVGQHTVGNLLVLDTWGPHQRLTFGRKSLPQLLDQPEKEWQPGEHIRLIHSGFPNLSVSGILGDHALVSQIFPGPDPHSTVTRQTVLVAEKPRDDAARAATQGFSDMVLKAVQEEDYGIGFGIEKTISSGANSEFLFGRNEPAVQNYHQWVARFMEQEAWPLKA